MYLMCDTVEAHSCENITPVRTINKCHNPLEFIRQVKQRFLII